MTGAVTAKATAELKTAVSDLEQARMLAGQVLPLAEKLAAGDTSVMSQLTALAGARLTFSLGQFDLGASYYNGYYKQPSVNAAKLDSYIAKYMNNQQILPEVTVMYGIENGDVVVLPKLAVKPASDVTLTASGMYLWNRDNDSEFAAWKDNSFVQLGPALLSDWIPVI